MSTKIYNGLIVRNKNFSDIYNDLLKLNNQLEIIKEKIILDFYFENYFLLLDYISYYNLEKITFKELINILPINYNFKKILNNKSEDNKIDIYKLIRLMFNEIIKNPNTKYLYVNTTFSLHLFPISKRKTLIYYICNNKNYINELYKHLPYLEKYDYYNNCDKPDEVTNKEWNQRKKDWDIALKNKSTINYYSLKFDLDEEFLDSDFTFLTSNQINTINKDYFNDNMKKIRTENLILLLKEKKLDEIYLKYKYKNNENYNKTKLSFFKKFKEDEEYKEYKKYLENNSIEIEKKLCNIKDFLEKRNIEIINNKNIEIERKFLVKKELINFEELNEKKLIMQGYIKNDKEQIVRIRISDNEAYITIKNKNIGISRKEYEYSIPLEDAKELLNKCDKIIEKERYHYYYESKLFEIDVFKRNLEGLILAEVELEDENEKILLPDFIKKEVSLDNKYFNNNLLNCKDIKDLI